MVKNLDVSVEMQAVQNYLRVSEGSKILQQTAALLDEARSLVTPRVLYVEGVVGRRTDCTAEINGVEFSSRVLSANLAMAPRLFPYVLTLGPELEARVAALPDLLAQYTLDAIGNLFLDAASESFEHHLHSTRSAEGLSKMNPGSLRDWPIEQQRQLFALVGDVESLLGVTLTSSFLMVPRKSTSGIMFPSAVEFFSCQLCPRAACINRKVPFDTGAVAHLGASLEDDSSGVCG